jgi:hypothetical protein
VPNTLLNLLYPKGRHGNSRQGKEMTWHDMEMQGKGKAWKIKVCVNGIVKNEKW